MNQFYFVKFSDNIETILADSQRLLVVGLTPLLNNQQLCYYTSHSKLREHSGFIIRTNDSMLLCALTLHGNITPVDLSECSANVLQMLSDTSRIHCE